MSSRNGSLSFLLVLLCVSWAHTQTPLILAARDESAEAVQALIDAGADLEARNEYGWTPLMWTAHNNENQETVQVLLDAGADAFTKDRDGKPAWDLIQDNEALKGTPVYWTLNLPRFQ